ELPEQMREVFSENQGGVFMSPARQHEQAGDLGGQSRCRAGALDQQVAEPEIVPDLKDVMQSRLSKIAIYQQHAPVDACDREPETVGYGVFSLSRIGAGNGDDLRRAALR